MNEKVLKLAEKIFKNENLLNELDKAETFD